VIPTGYGGKRILGFYYAPEGDQVCEIVRPQPDETFIGIEAGWYADGSRACIEIRRGQTLLRTVNCDYVTVVVFEE
jgi:hypothetical protein